MSMGCCCCPAAMWLLDRLLILYWLNAIWLSEPTTAAAT